jgi:hypothetical protein
MKSTLCWLNPSCELYPLTQTRSDFVPWLCTGKLRTEGAGAWTAGVFLREAPELFREKLTCGLPTLSTDFATSIRQTQD